MHVLFLDLSTEFLEPQEQLYYLAHTLLTSSTIKPFIACPTVNPLAKKCASTIPYIPLKGNNSIGPLMLFRLERILRKYSINILHTNDIQAATIGAFSKALHTDKLIFIHNKRTPEELPTGAKLKKFFLADKFIAVSEEIRKKIIKAGILPEKIHTIPSCINHSLYNQKKERNDGRFIFQSIGDLTSQKGYAVLLKAMHILKKTTLSPWEVRILGSGPLFQSLLNNAFELGVDSNLSLLGEQKKKELLPLADAIIVPSISNEGSNLTIKEGWITGIPVIASALESNEELIQNHVNGLLFPTGDPEALALAMLQCMQNKNLCERLVLSGKDSVKNYTLKTIGGKYIHFYESLKNLLVDTNSKS